MGIISCLGNDLPTVESALRKKRSGLRLVHEYAELGLQSRVAGIPDISGLPPINRKIRRFMGDTSVYAYYAMAQAILDAKLSDENVQSLRTGLIVGSGVGSPYEHYLAMDKLLSEGPGKIVPYAVPRIMGSTASACLTTAFGIRGISCSMSSACASSAHSIGYATELIQSGKQDLVFAGGAEEVQWTTTAPFEAMGALSTAYPDATASRPFDSHRDGFVIAGGAGILVLEEYEHARSRGAKIYGEIAGVGTCSDGADMVTPDKGGAARAMMLALQDAQSPVIDYINAHATSTPVGDISELEAIEEVFGRSRAPIISSTKGLSGHPIGAAGVHEAIYCMLMLNGNFLTGCANISEIDQAAAQFSLLLENKTATVNTILSNSFGFGGTNVSLLFKRVSH